MEVVTWLPGCPELGYLVKPKKIGRWLIFLLIFLFFLVNKINYLQKKIGR